MAEEIEDLIAGEWEGRVKGAAGLVVVYFYAPWCGHCKAFSPAFAKVAADMRGRAIFVKVNCDEEAAIVSEGSVRGMPTVSMFKDGVELDRHTGEESAQSLTARIEGYLAA